MKIGIVGNAADKFTPKTRRWARHAIRDVIKEYSPTHVISGGCHLGGVDDWAVEIAEKLGVETIIHQPKTRSWTGGYRPRNLRIAADSDIVVCVVAAKYPKKFDERRFESCYHCQLRRPPHCKSGGCYTAMRAALSEWRIISPNGWLAVPIRGYFNRQGKLVGARAS